MSKVDEGWQPGPLGTHTDDEGNPIADPEAPPAPKAEKPAAEPEPEKKPEPKPEPADDEPEDDGSEDSDFQDMTLEDIDSHIGEKVNEALANALKQKPEADDDLDPDTKALRDENARLKAELQQREQQANERAEKDARANIKHQVASAAGKYKMTAQEIKTVTDYMVANADLVVGDSGMGFEEAALRRLPQLRDRLKTSPDTSPRTGDGKAEGVIDAPSSSGPGAPKPWKHTAKPGDYSDITRHTLASGVSLGSRS